MPVETGTPSTTPTNKPSAMFDVSRLRNATINMTNAMDKHAQNAANDYFGSIKQSHGIVEKFFKTEEEVTLTPCFVGVQVFMTKYKGTGVGHQWMDTKIKGNLYVVRIKDVGIPMVVLRVYGADQVNREHDIVFEYELPINFAFQTGLTQTLTAIRLLRGRQALGFNFGEESECTRFNEFLTDLKKDLTIDLRKAKALQLVANDLDK